MPSLRARTGDPAAAAFRTKFTGRRLRLPHEEAPGALARDVVDVAVADDSAVMYPDGIERLPVVAEALDVGHVTAPELAGQLPRRTPRADQSDAQTIWRRYSGAYGG